MLYVGEIIKGKWNNNSYLILEKLGQGGVACVYKAKDKFANVVGLKISNDINSITREFENINKFKFIDIVPNAYEIDDYKKYGQTFHFFTMDYISGLNLKQIITTTNLNVREILGIAVIILDNLKKIYNLGYVYSDIKLENVMIDRKNKNIYLIDFGGVVGKDFGLKEYTPTYNMVSWGVNLKPDCMTGMIFSINMLMTCMILKKEASPMNQKIEDVVEKINKHPVDYRIKKLIIQGLQGKIENPEQYINKLKKLIYIKDKVSIKSGLDFIDIFFRGSIFLLLTVLIVCIKNYRH